MAHITILVFIGILGAVIGSFLNVVVLRLNTGVSLGGRSRCFTCAAQLNWYELLPIFSFLVLRGKCRKCRSAISFQYPAVELLSAALFIAVFLKVALFFRNIGGASYDLFLFAQLPWRSIALYWVVWSIFLGIAVYDIRHKMIPDVFVYSLSGFALLNLLVQEISGGSGIGAYAQAFATGPLLASPFFVIWFFSQGRAMGFGDVKLAVATGWLFSVPQVFAVFVFSFWVGGAVALVLLFRQLLRGLFRVRKNALSPIGLRVTMKSEIPFAPFLIAGVAIVFFCDMDVYSLVMLFEHLWF